MTGDAQRPEVTLTRDGPVATITLCRPHRRNAMTRAMTLTLLGYVEQVSTDADVRVLVLTGEGDRAFSAGADLHEMRALGEAATPPPRPMGGVHRNLYEAVAETPVPTVAAINGWAVGGGLELALACDLRIAAEHARLAVPEARRGLGATVASVLLPRLIPPARALEMLYTGDPMTAQEALACGLLNRVVPGERLAAEAAALAARIAANAPLSLRRSKQAFVKGRALPVAAALRLDVGPDPYTSADRREGVAAFLEHREPRWQGR